MAAVPGSPQHARTGARFYAPGEGGGRSRAASDPVLGVGARPRSAPPVGSPLLETDPARVAGHWPARALGGWLGVEAGRRWWAGVRPPGPVGQVPAGGSAQPGAAAHAGRAARQPSASPRAAPAPVGGRDERPGSARPAVAGPPGPPAAAPRVPNDPAERDAAGRPASETRRRPLHVTIRRRVVIKVRELAPNKIPAASVVFFQVPTSRSNRSTPEHNPKELSQECT